MTDYKIEAVENLKLALTMPAGYQHLDTSALLTIALVNATLEMAEQQRIANLLALNANYPTHAAQEAGARLDRLRMGVAGEVWDGLGLS